jgi:hypothetical protein
MSEQPRHSIDIGFSASADAHEFAPLLADYVQALKRGAPRRPDDFYAETLLQDATVNVLGASVDGKLVGFAIFHDLPDPVSGLRVRRGGSPFRASRPPRPGDRPGSDRPAGRRGRIARLGALVLNAPRQPEDGRKLYEQIAAPADWTATSSDSTPNGESARAADRFSIPFAGETISS